VTDMLGLSRKSIILVTIICGLKVVGTTLVPFSPNVASDFYAWVAGARLVLVSLSQGSMPPLAQTGVYTGLFVILAPFFWLWTILPIPHPSLVEMAAGPSIEEYLLVLIMKIPVIVSDLFTGILTALLVRRATQSSKTAEKAFLIWYLNPLNAFWMYYSGDIDVIPALVVLFAVLFGNSKQWIRSGLSLAVATLLRLYPLLLLPFFLLYSIRDRPRSPIRFLASFLAPVLLVLLGQSYVIGSFNRVLSAALNIPLSQNWLLAYYGFSIVPGLFQLTPFLLLVQFYLIARYWKESNYSLLHFSLAPLLVLFSASYTQPYHFMWVSAFLTAYYVMEKDRLQLFVLTFLFASLYVEAFTYQQPLNAFQPLIAGFFFGTKATYLFKLNFGAMRSQMRRVYVSLHIPHAVRPI
jgi:Gpi18-like mannosyltransferase